MIEHIVTDDAQLRLRARVLEDLNGRPFVPAPWLSGPHAQTMLAGRYLRRHDMPELRVERWTTEDDDFLQLYFMDRDPSKPTVLILHGLEGSVSSCYVGGMLEEIEARNWNAVVMEHRSCSGEINRARRMYHSGETSDLEWVVHRLIERRPDMRLFLCGYSLGGNVTGKWLGQTGDDVPQNVIGGAVVSAPYDLVASAVQMDRAVRRWYVLHFMRTLVPKAIAKERQYPGCLDVEKVRRARTFKQFDDHATAPLHGFVDAHDYYSQSGCGQYLQGIRRPTLLVSADDDPFNPGSSLPRALAAEHPYLHAQFTERGGHVGFVGRNPDGSPHYWAEAQIMRFFEAYADRG